MPSPKKVFKDFKVPKDFKDLNHNSRQREPTKNCNNDKK